MCGAALRYRRDLPPGRSTTAARAPVVLVHGFAHNPSAWLALADHLHAEGFGDLRAVRYGWRDDVPTIARAVATQVDAAVDASGAGGGRVHVVAHSLGGVAVRYWHDVLGGVDARPPWSPSPRRTRGHRGPGCRSAARATTCTRGRRSVSAWRRRAVRTTAGRPSAAPTTWWCPGHRARLPGVRHVEVAEGHVGLLTSPLAADHVCTALLAAEDARRVAAAV